MSTDDRDIESSNPSKNFQVGDFDQRSGFFTPVWESKRRIRSEPPGPPSSANGSSRNGRPASSPSGEAGEASVTEGSAASKAKSGKSSRSRSAAGGKGKGISSTPPPPAASAGTPATLATEPLPPAVAAVFNPTVELEPKMDAGLQPEAAAGVAPAPAAVSSGSLSSGSLSSGSLSSDPSSEAPSSEALSSEAQPSAASPSAAEASARPSAAARALRDAGPNLPPAAFLDAEPEFRDRDAVGRTGVPSPEERTDRSPIHQRSLRATSAAARIHEQLKAKLQAEAAELDESRFDQTPDSQLPPLNSQDQENELYPQSLMRRLRRTIRLSTPVPDPIRSLISKYDRG